MTKYSYFLNAFIYIFGALESEPYLFSYCINTKNFGKPILCEDFANQEKSNTEKYLGIKQYYFDENYITL